MGIVTRGRQEQTNLLPQAIILPVHHLNNHPVTHHQNPHTIHHHLNLHIIHHRVKNRLLIIARRAIVPAKVQKNMKVMPGLNTIVKHTTMN